MPEQEVARKRIFIPQMSEHAFALAGVMRGMDIDAEVLPKPDDVSMTLGKATCRGRECLPCLLCTGDLLRKCRETDFDIDGSVFFMPQTQGACRFGQYHVLQKQILAEEGFPDAVLVSPSSADSYTMFGDDPLTLRKRAWHGVVAVDLLTKILHEKRPYELTPGSADALYLECLDLIVAAAEAGAGDCMIEAMEGIARRFAALPVDVSEPRPLIGVIGELYLMLNARANLEIVRAVERHGGEALQGTAMEYLSYVDWKRQAVAWRLKAYGQLFKGALSDQYQKRWAYRLLEPLEPVLRHPIAAPIKESMAELRKHYEPLLGTEAVLTMGSAFDVHRHGAAGIINILPFSCMAGTIVASMAPVLRQDMEGIPWLDIAYDGQEETNIHTRLGAFMHQALQFHRRIVLPRQEVRVEEIRPPEQGEQLIMEKPPEFDRPRIVRGVGLFAAFTAAGLAILVALTGGREALAAVRDLSLGFLGLALLLAVVDLLLGTYRYFIFLRQVKADVPFGLALRAQLANRFAAAITPSQTGGGPALLYIFSRGGIPVAQGLSVLLVNFLATLVFFFVSIALAAYILRDTFSNNAIGYLIQYGFVAFGVMTVISIVALMRPVFLRRVLRGLSRRLGKREQRWRSGLAGLLERLTESAETYHETCMHFIGKTPGLLVASLALISLMYLTKFTIAYCLVLGLGVGVDYLMTVAVQAVLQFVLYLAPSPGGSGFAELSTGALMAILIPAALLSVFTIAFRFFLVLLPAFAGSFVLIGALRESAAEKRKPDTQIRLSE
jgi:uncharacterized protein (TIRG00374 family)